MVSVRRSNRLRCCSLQRQTLEKGANRKYDEIRAVWKSSCACRVHLRLLHGFPRLCLTDPATRPFRASETDGRFVESAPRRAVGSTGVQCHHPNAGYASPRHRMETKRVWSLLHGHFRRASYLHSGRSRSGCSLAAPSEATRKSSESTRNTARDVAAQARTNICRGCGCRVAAYGMAVFNKIKMATQHCPREKW